MRRYWLILPALFFLVIGCGPAEKTAADKKKADIEAAVVWYNALLADCFRDFNMNAMAQVATADRAQKAYLYMASLGEAGLRMDGTLEKIDFGVIRETSADQVVIEVAEAWEYIYFDIKTGENLFDNSVEYDLLYELVNQSGSKWLVSDITVKKTRESKDSSFIFQRPIGSRPGEPLMPRESKGAGPGDDEQ